MPDHTNHNERDASQPSGRRNFLFAALGGVVAAVAGWIAGAFPKGRVVERPVEQPAQQPISPEFTDAILERVAALEAELGQLAARPPAADSISELAHLEGEMNERVVFQKSELTVRNPEGVLLNLVSPSGHVGIRFYKDFDFGNERTTNPWHMGFIEGIEGYQGLAILRDWRFTAALWDADGKLLLGSLDPHPPANEPAKGRVNIKGTLDEVQLIVEGNTAQATDILQVVGGDGERRLAVDGAGRTILGSSQSPMRLVLHDTENGTAYALGVTDGQLTLQRV